MSDEDIKTADAGSGRGDNSGPGGGGHEHPPGGGHEHKFEIQIDRVKYKVTQSVMTGAQLRALPSGGIPPDRDLFEVVPGAPDKKIGDNDPCPCGSGKKYKTCHGKNA